MTWFRVDDKLHSHRKRMRAGVPAIGLWTLAGSWCSDHLTDGFVPDYVALGMDLEAETHAAALVTAGLWHTDEHDGDRGWRFHGWAEHQPTREGVEQQRADAAERKRRQRERGAESRTTQGQFAGRPTDVTRDSHGTHVGVTAKSHDPVTDLSSVSRPDPTRPVLPTEVGSAGAPTSSSAPTTRTSRGTRVPDSFTPTDEMKTWAAEKAPNASAAEHEKFMDHWRSQPGSKGVKLDWTATWRNWMRNARPPVATPSWIRTAETPAEEHARQIAYNRRQYDNTGAFDMTTDWTPPEQGASA